MPTITRVATNISAGAKTATDHTASAAILSSLTTARAAFAIRLTIDFPNNFSGTNGRVQSFAPCLSFTFANVTKGFYRADINSLKGKVALITGAAGAIGLATAGPT